VKQRSNRIARPARGVRTRSGPAARKQKGLAALDGHGQPRFGRPSPRRKRRSNTSVRRVITNATTERRGGGLDNRGDIVESSCNGSAVESGAHGTESSRVMRPRRRDHAQARPSAPHGIAAYACSMSAITGTATRTGDACDRSDHLRADDARLRIPERRRHAAAGSAFAGNSSASNSRALADVHASGYENRRCAICKSPQPRGASSSGTVRPLDDRSTQTRRCFLVAPWRQTATAARNLIAKSPTRPIHQQCEFS